MATFNGRLRQLMKEKGFTQHKLAEAVDVSEPSVYSYYHGFTTPRLDVLVAIAKVFDVTTDYLLGLEDFNAKERFVDGIAVTKTGWDADDEICCPICGSILLFILFGSITLSFWSVCIASSRADKKLEYLHLQKEKGEHYVR